MSVFKRVLSVILLLCVCFSAISCKEEVKNREYNKSEVEAAAESLIEKSLVLNELLFGAGIEYIRDDETNIYKIADEKSLEHFNISSIGDIRNMASEVFSSKYIESIENSDILNPVVVDDVTLSFARYFEDTDDDGKNIIYVNSSYNYALKNVYEYTSKAIALRAEGDFVIVSAIVKATREDGFVKNFTHEIKLIEESDGWRLASSTYVVYNEYTDIYEDMVD